MWWCLLFIIYCTNLSNYHTSALQVRTTHKLTAITARGVDKTRKSYVTIKYNPIIKATIIKNQQMKVTNVKPKVTSVKTNQRSNIVTDKKQGNINKLYYHIYSSTLNTFQDIRNNLDTDETRNEIDAAKQTFKKEFKEFVDKTQTNKVKLDAVALAAVDFLRSFADNLLAPGFNKIKEINTAMRMTGIVHNSFEKLIHEEYNFVCDDLKVCRQQMKFTKALITFIDVLLKSKRDNAIEHAYKYFMEEMKVALVLQMFYEPYKFWDKFRAEAKKDASTKPNGYTLDEWVPITIVTGPKLKKLEDDIRLYVNGTIVDERSVFKDLANIIKGHKVLATVPTISYTWWAGKIPIDDYYVW